MKKVSSRPEFGSSSSFTADLFDEDASSLGSLINRPEAVGSTDLAQNSNFFQKLQLAQNSLRSQDLDGGSGGNLRDFESFSPSAASTNVDSRLSRPEERFLPLVSGPAAVVKTRTGGGGAVFPQDSDIITADSTSGVGSSLSSVIGAASSGGFSQDFDFEESPRFEKLPSENLFRVSSQLRVGGGATGREEEEKGEELRFPGSVLEDATTRKIGDQ